MMKVAIISPYHGGSHQAWARGYQTHSTHAIRLLTLPARFWKWRMHGGAVTLARQFLEGNQQPDLLLATDMLDLTTFLALTRSHTSTLPTALYMHENQLTYPLPKNRNTGPMRRQKGERDLHYFFINYTSMLAADTIFFNSHYHRNSLFDALPNFLKHFPEYNLLETVEQVSGKSGVLPVGVDFESLETERQPATPRTKQPPLIIWNQRWEYDKNPAAFFNALYTVAEEGLPFRLALCGEQFGRQPPSFAQAQSRLKDQIVHAGYADKELYRSLLWQAEITISTAVHEFFGISILEAIYCHTFPILPRRLSYPELIAEPFHQRTLYQDQSGLVQRLRWALTHRQEAAAAAAALASTVARFGWQQIAPTYDTILTEMFDDSLPDATLFAHEASRR